MNLPSLENVLTFNNMHKVWQELDAERYADLHQLFHSGSGNTLKGVGNEKAMMLRFRMKPHVRRKGSQAWKLLPSWVNRVRYDHISGVFWLEDGTQDVTLKIGIITSWGPGGMESTGTYWELDCVRKSTYEKRHFNMMPFYFPKKETGLGLEDRAKIMGVEDRDVASAHSWEPTTRGDEYRYPIVYMLDSNPGECYTFALCHRSCHKAHYNSNVERNIFYLPTSFQQTSLQDSIYEVLHRGVFLEMGTNNQLKDHFFKDLVPVFRRWMNDNPDWTATHYLNDNFGFRPPILANSEGISVDAQKATAYPVIAVRLIKQGRVGGRRDSNLPVGYSGANLYLPVPVHLAYADATEGDNTPLAECTIKYFCSVENQLPGDSCIPDAQAWASLSHTHGTLEECLNMLSQLYALSGLPV